MAACSLLACGNGNEVADEPVASTSVDAQSTGGRCVVRLHGKGGDGSSSTIEDDVVDLYPAGNAEGWGGRQWLYFPDEHYDEALAIVVNAVDDAGCTSAAIGGFSNGASFAAAIYCRGEDLGGRLRGVVIDDPVTDHGADTCSPAANVDAALYWTTALDRSAPPGTDCEAIDWTCLGGDVIGIDAFATNLGLPIQPSPFTAHTWYVDAPELVSWLSS